MKINLNQKKKIFKILAKIETPVKTYENKDNIYISCIFDDKSNTYIFNTSEETFKLINKLDIVSYIVSFNDAYIVATNEAMELTINRVTGKGCIRE
jgi:sialic acid synthase SpsE